METKLKYTTILHEAREKLELSLVEYSIADSIYHLSNNPKSKINGWCYASKESIAKFFGITSRTIFNNIEKLIKKGLVEKDEETKYLRTTQIWYDCIILTKMKKEYEESSQGMKKFHSGMKKVHSKVGKNFIPTYEKVSHYNNKDNNNNKNIDNEIANKFANLNKKMSFN